MDNSLVTTGLSQEQIDLIKTSVAPDFTNDELSLFLYTCGKYNLDPMQKQVYGFKSRGKALIMTSIDGLRLIAERTGRYAPGRDTEFAYTENGELISAKVYVKKQTIDGTWHEMSASALLVEYKPKNAKSDSTWSKLAHVMLEKVAESRALRRCFPLNMSGLYSKEELDQVERDGQEVIAIPPAPPQVENKKLISKQMLDLLVVFTKDFPGITSQILSDLNVDSLANIKEEDVKEVRRICDEWRNSFYGAPKKDSE